MRYVSFLLSKKVLQHQNPVLFNYGIFYFLYVHQVVTSLAWTEILFQNNLNILKLVIFILGTRFDIWFTFLATIASFALFTKIKARVRYFLSIFFVFHHMIAFRKLWKMFLFHLVISCFYFFLPLWFYKKVILSCLKINLKLSHILTLFRMGFFGATHGWGRPKRPPSLKSVTHILQWWNFDQLYLTQRRSRKYMNHVTHPLSSADIRIFSPEISKFCYFKNYRYRLSFDT